MGSWKYYGEYRRNKILYIAKEKAPMGKIFNSMAEKDCNVDRIRLF